MSPTFLLPFIKDTFAGRQLAQEMSFKIMATCCKRAGVKIPVQVSCRLALHICRDSTQVKKMGETYIQIANMQLAGIYKI